MRRQREYQMRDIKEIRLKHKIGKLFLLWLRQRVMPFKNRCNRWGRLIEKRRLD